MAMPKKSKKQQAESVNKFKISAGFLAVIVLVGALFVLMQPRSTVPAGFEPQVIGAPSLMILSEEVIDHGDVPVNQFVETEFVIQNVGDEDLIILGNPIIEVVEGCCPSQTTVDDQILSPGEITTIRTSFTMHPGMDGYHDFRVHVRTNDPVQPNKSLTILSNWI